MLSDYLHPECIRLQVEVEDWEEAVRTAGGLLLDAERCEPRYVEAMVDAVNEMGPYMVLAPGLALVHARPEDGVTEISISLITLTPPVEFGSERNDPVSLVIAFGAVDKEKHLDMLQQLALFLEKPDHRQILSDAVSVDEVMALMEDV
jgi:mannitol/fructose-specific phosphotransferase system IIA component (Ntr-type)